MSDPNKSPVVYEHDIIEYLNQYVKGQDDVIKKLAFLGHMYTLSSFAVSCGIKKKALPKMNMLITGPTGYGKTHTIRHFANSIGAHYKKLDCTSISAEGWKGTSLSLFIYEFLMGSRYGFGVLHLDEIDKVSVENKDQRDHKLELQQSLLDLLDGDYNYMYDKQGFAPIPLDNINNCLIVMSGSFQTDRNEKTNYKNIGFKHTEEPEDKRTYKDKLIELGFMHEFASRVICSAELGKYNEEQVRDIILNTKESAYIKYRNIFNKYDLDSEEVDKLVHDVLENKNGLRELDSLLFQKFYEKRGN